MAEPDTNPLKISPVETVEDAYANVYDSFEPFEISEEEIFEQVRAAKTPKEAANNMATEIVDAMINGYNLPEVSLSSLKDGSSPFYKYLREKSADRDSFGNIKEGPDDATLDRRGFGTDENILNFFSNLNFKENPALQGFFNQVGPAAAFMTAFTTSAQQIYKRAPGTPFQKMMYAGIGSLTSGFLASGAVDYIQENVFEPVEFELFNAKIKLFGQEEPTLPTQRASYLSGKAFADFITFMPMPYLVRNGVKMSSAQVLSNLRDRAKMIENSQVIYKAPVKKGFFGTSRPTPLGKELETYLSTGKFSATRRFSNFIDDLLRGGISFAKDKKLPYILTETGFATGATMGTRFAEEKYPGDFLPRFGAETSAGFTGAIGSNVIAYPATRIFLGTAKAVYNLFTKRRFTDKPFSETKEEIKDKFGKFRERQGVKGFLNFLEKYGVNSEKFVERLEKAYLGMDKKFLEEFNLDITALDKLAKQSVGFRSGEPAAILYESALMSNFDALGPKRKEMFEAAQGAVLNILKILKGSGNDEALKVAAQIETEMLKNQVATNIDTAIKNALISFRQLRGENNMGTPKSNMELSEVIFNTIKNQYNLFRKRESELYQKIKDFDIDNTFDGSADGIPRFLDAFNDPTIMPKDPYILSKLAALPGFKDAFVLAKRLNEQLGLAESPGIIKRGSDKLETEMQDLVRSFDITVLGQQKNRLQTKLDEVNDKVVDFDGDVDFAQKALTFLKSNAPVKIDTARKGFTRDQITNFTKIYNEDMKIHKAALKYYNTYLKQAKLNKVVEVDDADEIVPVTYQSLIEFRSELLEESRKAYANKENRKGKRLAMLAEALREDLRRLENDADAPSALKDANRFSLAGNDVFTRSLIGKAVISKEKSGGFNTPPELLFEKIKSLDDATAFRYKELENIHNFLRENNILEDTSFKDTPTYNNILYSLVRNNKLLNSLTSNKTVKTSDGEKKSLEMLNKTSAENLLKSPNAREILKFFPELETDLKDAIKKQSLLEITLDADGDFVKSLIEQGSLARILQFDDPSAYMAEMLRGKQPITNLTNALKEAREYVAKNSKGDALKFTKNIATIDGQSKKVTSILNLDSINNGFKEAILTHVLTKSGMNQGGRFNPQKAYALLFEPMAGVGGRKRTSLSMWMKNSGLIDEKQLKLFRETLISMSKIDVQMRGGDINIDEFNAFQNFTFGVLGSVIGTGTQKAMGRIIPGMGEGMGPGSIIAANQGAQLARNIFMAIPESLRQSAMIKVMSDPQLFLQLNKELKDGAPLNYFGALLGALKKAGLIASSISLKQLIPVIKQDEDEGKPPFSEFIKQKLKVDQDSIPPDEASVDLPEEGFPTTQTAMAPPSGLNTRLAANVGTAPQAAPNTALRQQFASVFPNDPISGLINAQQPVRMMRQGGAAFDMGLETDRAAQESIQSALESGSDDNQTQTQSFNFGNVPTTIRRGIESLMSNIKTVPDTTGIQSFVTNNTGQTALPISYQTNIGSFPVSIQPTFPFGVQFTTTFANGGEVDDGFSFDDDVIDYTDQGFNYSYVGDSTSRDDYDEMRGATTTNPYPESFFSRMGRQFGFDVDYSNILNTPGGYTVESLNQLRYDQAMNPEKYKAGDFYEGQPTRMGPVERMPATGIQQLIGSIPYVGGITRILPQDTLPADDPRMIRARQQRDADVSIFNRIFGR